MGRRGIVMWIIIGMVAGGVAKLIMTGRSGRDYRDHSARHRRRHPRGFLGAMVGLGGGAAGLIGSIITPMILLDLYQTVGDSGQWFPFPFKNRCEPMK